MDDLSSNDGADLKLTLHALSPIGPVAIWNAPGVVALMLLSLPGRGLGASLLFGLIGMAPAGVILALAGEAMRPQVRPLGMGIFFTVYFAIMMDTPPAAGAILDATGSAQRPIWLATLLFVSVVPLAMAFQYFKSTSPLSNATEIQSCRLEKLYLPKRSPHQTKWADLAIQ